MATGRSERRIDHVLHVSAGMREDGGGTAHLGRLIGASLRRFCAQRGLKFRGFHLPALDGGVSTDGYRSFARSKPRLTASVLWRLVAARGTAALFFDHVGPARLLSLVPAHLLPRYAIQLHGIEIWQQLSAGRRRILERATLLVANSQYTADHATRFLPAHHQIRVVLLGIEPQVVVGRADSDTINAVGEGFALIVGRAAELDRYKGHDELLECWGEVRQRHPGARLVVAGSGTDLERLRAKAAALDVDGSVVFTGQVDPPTLAELYRRAAFFAMPSLHEGFGLVFAEAMAAGKACLALEGTAPAEVVVAGETGLLVREGDRLALVDGLVRLFADPERTREMGESGRRRYEEEFTAAAYERRLWPVLEELTAT